MPQLLPFLLKSAVTSPCDCPKRQMPPPKPTELPLQATEENRECLQQWLLDYYASSTFNTCTHQPMPLTDCPPPRLMIDPDANQLHITNPYPSLSTGKMMMLRRD